MLIVGELINTSRKAIKEAVEEGNIEYLKGIAAEQVKAGASYVDVNCGTLIDKEPETMQWLVENVQQAVKEPLCIDTPNPAAMEVGLSLHKNGQPMVNSISAEKERFEAVLPLVLKYKAKVVALCLDDQGIPDNAEDRIRIVRQLVKDLTGAGVKPDDIYIDPLIKPVSTGDRAGMDALETIRFIKTQYPEVHAICGLSNISFGLPKRKVLNEAFMIQTMAMGMDAYILDPLNKTMMGYLYASRAVLGRDPYCGQYLAAYRRGLYND